MATYTNSRIQLRVDTEGAWQSNNPTIQPGELCISSDKNDFKVGTGSAWNQAAYCIKNNPEVVAIKTTANNAASSASNALNRANQAYSLAQSAAQSSGRRSTTEVFDRISTGGNVVINAEFIDKFKNYNLNSTKSVAGVTLEISSFGMKPSEANEIVFNYVTKDSACKFTGARMTRNIDDVSERNKLLVVFGEKSGINDDTLGAITFKPNSFVKIKIVDTWYIKIDATSLS